MSHAAAIDPAAYIPFIESIASRVHRVYGNQVPREDLVSYGMLGLMDAADRYEPEPESPFERFAYYRVFGAMLDGTRRWTTGRAVARLRRREEERARVEGREQAHRPGRPAILRLVNPKNEQAVEGCADFRGGSRDNGQRSPESVVNLGDMADALKDLLDTLDDQERRIIELYYFDDESFRDVAAQIGVSPSWLCRIHKGILEKLRCRLATRGIRREVV